MGAIEHVELHDSRVSSISPGVVVVLDAFVHHWEHDGSAWVGVGRRQSARLTLVAGHSVVARPMVETTIDGGWLRIGDELHENLLPVPLRATRAIVAHLDLMDSNSIDLEGTAVHLELVGPSRDVDSLPAEWAPGCTPTNPALKPPPKGRRG